MNMIQHDNPEANIVQGNTLADPRFFDSSGSLKTFDYVVANPPFSDKRWSNGIDPQNDQHNRFKSYGTPPAKQGDFAYLLHIIRSLKSTGKGACILPHGVLFRGNAEGEIRKNLLKKGFIKGIIGLPANLFYGTGITACIVVIDKSEQDIRKGIFIVDASAGFLKDGPKNRLRDRDVHQIVDVFTRQQEIPGYSRMVSLTEIEENDYNLNIPRYIESQETEDIQDIETHLKGDVPIVTSSGFEDYHFEHMIKGPGVVTGRYGTIGKVHFIEGNFWPLNTTLFVRDFHGNDPLFVYYLLQTIDYQTHSGKSGYTTC